MIILIMRRKISASGRMPTPTAGQAAANRNADEQADEDLRGEPRQARTPGRRRRPARRDHRAAPSVVRANSAIADTTRSCCARVSSP